MGNYYSISTYIKKENVSSALQWLYENSSGFSYQPLVLKKYDSSLKVTFVDGPGENTSCSFSTALVLDIDPEVIEALLSTDLDGNLSLLEIFKEDFQEVYLGNGKVCMSGFEANIFELSNHDVVELTLTAVTSSLSFMLATSTAVKKWLLDFSKISQAVVTLLDFEDSLGILYYRGTDYYEGAEITLKLRDGYRFEDPKEYYKNEIPDSRYELLMKAIAASF